MVQEAPKITVHTIKTELEQHVGEKIRFMADMGRSRDLDSEGFITGLYADFFNAELHKNRNRKERNSFQYAEILTGSIELYDAETMQPLFEMG
jgi:uncharacterized protein Veg